jgi:ferredoxin
MEELLLIKGIEGATVEIEVSSFQDSISHKITMKGDLFIEKYLTAVMTAEELNKKLNASTTKKKFEIPERTFISPPLPKSAKALKLATNPEFAAAFAGLATGASAVGAVVVNNFSVSKVWIEPGCIVCDACEAIFPEVFEVTDSTCIIRPGAPLNDGLKIQESAEACPVEVIKFTKVG